jgi:hypothetical protein
VGPSVVHRSRLRINYHSSFSRSACAWRRCNSILTIRGAISLTSRKIPIPIFERSSPFLCKGASGLGPGIYMTQGGIDCGLFLGRQRPWRDAWNSNPFNTECSSYPWDRTRNRHPAGGKYIFFPSAG